MLAIRSEQGPEGAVVGEVVVEPPVGPRGAAREPHVGVHGDADAAEDHGGPLALVLLEHVVLLEALLEKPRREAEEHGPEERDQRGGPEAVAHEERLRPQHLETGAGPELHPVLLGNQAGVAELLVAVGGERREVLLLDLREPLADDPEGLDRQVEEGRDVLRVPRPVEGEGRDDDEDDQRDQVDEEREDAPPDHVPEHLIVGVDAVLVLPDDAVDQRDAERARDDEVTDEQPDRRAVLGTLVVDPLDVRGELGRMVRLRREQVRDVELGILVPLHSFEPRDLAGGGVDGAAAVSVVEGTSTGDVPAVPVQAGAAGCEEQGEQDRGPARENQPLRQERPDEVDEVDAEAEVPEGPHPVGPGDTEVPEAEFDVLDGVLDTVGELVDAEVFEAAQHGQKPGRERPEDRLEDRPEARRLLLFLLCFVCHLSVPSCVRPGVGGIVAVGVGIVGEAVPAGRHPAVGARLVGQLRTRGGGGRRRAPTSGAGSHQHGDDQDDEHDPERLHEPRSPGERERLVEGGLAAGIREREAALVGDSPVPRGTEVDLGLLRLVGAISQPRLIDALARLAGESLETGISGRDQNPLALRILLVTPDGVSVREAEDVRDLLRRHQAAGRKLEHISGLFRVTRLEGLQVGDLERDAVLDGARRRGGVESSEVVADVPRLPGSRQAARRVVVGLALVASRRSSSRRLAGELVPPELDEALGHAERRLERGFTRGTIGVGFQGVELVDHVAPERVEHSLDPARHRPHPTDEVEERAGHPAVARHGFEPGEHATRRDLGDRDRVGTERGQGRETRRLHTDRVREGGHEDGERGPTRDSVLRDAFEERGGSFAEQLLSGSLGSLDPGVVLGVTPCHCLSRPFSASVVGCFRTWAS